MNSGTSHRPRSSCALAEASPRQTPDAQSSHWLYRALPKISGNSGTRLPSHPHPLPLPRTDRTRAESSSLAQEIAGLRALEFEMARNLDALKQRQAHARFSKTLAGRVFNWGGRVFAVYCVYRIISVRPTLPPSLVLLCPRR